MSDDPTPLGDAMSHRFPDQEIPQQKPGAGASRSAPSMADRPSLPANPKRMAADEGPLSNDDPQPNDPKPRAPDAEDEPGRRVVPVELPGKPHAPERV